MVEESVILDPTEQAPAPIEWFGLGRRVDSKRRDFSLSRETDWSIQRLALTHKEYRVSYVSIKDQVFGIEFVFDLASDQARAVRG